MPACTARASDRLQCGAVSNLWSNAGNWTRGVPQAGQTLVFLSNAANFSNTNDLPAGMSFATLAFGGMGYTIGGNGIVLTTSLTSAGLNNIVNLPIDVQANAVNVIVTGGGNAQLNGSLSGTGSIALRGGAATLSGAHTFSGTLTVTSDGNSALTLNNASLPNASIVNNLYFAGTGTVGSFTSINAGFTMDVFLGGAGTTGILNTGNLALIAPSGTTYFDK